MGLNLNHHVGILLPILLYQSNECNKHLYRKQNHDLNSKHDNHDFYLNRMVQPCSVACSLFESVCVKLE